MTVLFVWLLVALALAFVIATATMWFVGRLARRRLSEAREEATRTGAATLRVAPSAQFFGRAATGPRQSRGDGVLILTAEELRFDLWAPQRRLVIPLRAVARVDTTKRHAGRYSVRPLLRVAWRDEYGAEDAAAWALRDQDEWVAAVVAAARNAQSAGAG